MAFQVICNDYQIAILVATHDVVKVYTNNRPFIVMQEIREGFFFIHLKK